jgi:hypothetical protein
MLFCQFLACGPEYANTQFLQLYHAAVYWKYPGIGLSIPGVGSNQFVTIKKISKQKIN